MDLGTGKDINEYVFNDQQVSYHLVDIVDAGYKYNVFEYQNDFLKVYSKLKEKSILPILCGGSGMYIEAVLKGYKLINVPVNEVLRAELDLLSLPELTAKLGTYKKLHNRTDVDTKKRAIRAIEIAAFTEMNGEIELEYPKLNSLILGINLERELVRNKITSRLKQRLREGMIEEVEALIKNGVPTETLVYYGLEYKYIAQFLNKELSYNAMVEKLNIAIHQFSRRQMTWFRKMEREGFNIQWIDGSLSMDEKVSHALRLLQQYSK
jgi:tRNA dimethylallyltransferase